LRRCTGSGLIPGDEVRARFLLRYMPIDSYMIV
jgi:hypothetical protein